MSIVPVSQQQSQPQSSLPSFLTEARELLMAMCRALADKPEAVEIQASEGFNTVLLVIRCDKSDVGKLIGKGGRLADSMRFIMNCVAVKHRRRVVFDIEQ